MTMTLCVIQAGRAPVFFDRAIPSFVELTRNSWGFLPDACVNE